MLLVAIDGPVGSGKSTVARAVAGRLGVEVLDTGAMYRSLAWAAIERGVDVEVPAEVAGLARALEIEVGEKVTVDGVDVTTQLRRPDVNQVVSQVASHAEVRKEMARRQREWAERRGGGVVEGRDIGSVVFPDASLKVFLTASEDERARRRSGDEEAAAVARRDRLDSSRTTSPLAPAADAFVIDTTGMDVDGVVDEIVSRL